MFEERIQAISGATFDKREIDDIVEKTFQKIMAELPEEMQTYDIILYILQQIKMRLKGSKIRLQ